MNFVKESGLIKILEENIMANYITKFLPIVLLVIIIPTMAFSVVNVGDEAPDFTLRTPAGDSVKLSDFSDRIVVLFFLGYN